MTQDSDDTTEEQNRRLRDLEAWQDAVKNQLVRLREENQELKDRVAELEDLVDPDPGATDYHSLTKEQKVRRIRKTLVENAMATSGTDSMMYKSVMTLFDGHPSAGHCYNLMERAAELEGFQYDQAGGSGQKRVRVNVTDVKDEALLHSVNKADGSVTA